MTLTIHHLGHRGDGVARGAEGPVYVPRTLPGEVVDGDRDGDRIPEPRILEPSPDRVAPPCPHFRRCGGCALQHASDLFVARWKAQGVARTLRQAGLGPSFTGVVTSPANARRRAALSGRKTKGGAVVGFHTPRGDDIVAIPECRLLHPDLMAALPALEEITRIAAPRGEEITLHLTRSAAGLDLAIETSKPLDRAATDALAPLAAGFARIVWDGEVALQTAPPVLRMAGAPVPLPPGAFLQATASGEAALVARVTEALGGAGRVVDLFAGCGTFTFPAARTAAVTAVEGAAALTGALAAGARGATGLKPVEAVTRDLFRDPLTAGELARFDAAIIDPPRAGAAAQMAELAQSDLSVIAHVSCNPATFARDAAVLAAAGWRMGPVTVVDQFRWSAHVELVAAFTRD